MKLGAAPGPALGDRFAADLDATYVSSGSDGVQVCSGRVAELGVGGCTFVVDGDPPERDGRGVLVVATPVGHLAVLTSEPLGERGRSDAVALRFVHSVDHDASWSDYVCDLAGDQPG